MGRKIISVSSWYAFFLITLIVIMGMFWFNYQKVNQQSNVTTIQEEIARPIPDTINAKVIENLKTRNAISDSEVVNLQISSRKLSTSSAIMEEQEIVEPIIQHPTSTGSGLLLNNQ